MNKNMIDLPPVLYDVPAHSIEVGDQVIIDNDPIEVKAILDSPDIDEVIVKGYSHLSGDTEQYSLYADDVFGVWSL